MDNIGWYDRWLYGELSREEKAVFDARLSADREFAAQFRIYVMAVMGIWKEAEQDNMDFSEAMKRISVEELLRIFRESRCGSDS